VGQTFDVRQQSETSSAVSGFVSGRVCYFWPNSMDTFVDVIGVESNSMCALHDSNDSCDLLLINVYMPVESTELLA